MRLTRQSNYAIRTLVYCAVNGSELSRIGEIAKAYGISELFLFKLIKPLVENGLLETVRGRHGGVRLGKPANRSPCSTPSASPKRVLPWPNASRTAPTAR